MARLCVLALLLALPGAAGEAYCYVSTLAGAGVGYGDGLGTAARFSSPASVTLDREGNAYVADLATRTVRKVTPAGQVTTLAGTGRGASPPADGVGTLASFGAPEGVAFDASTGSLLVVDEKNNMLRRVSLAGVVSFVAGNVSGGYADGVGAAASFMQPSGVDVDGASGVAYVADLANHRIRRVDASGTVTTLAGGFLGGTWPEAVDGVGTAARFFRPIDLASDGAGGLYVSDWGNGLIRRVDVQTGSVTTVAGNCGSGRIPFNTQSLNDNTCYGNLTDGVGTAAVLNHPSGLTFSPPSTLYFTDSQNNAIRSLDVLTREVKTLTGTGLVGYADGQCSAAVFNTPMDLAVDANGNLIVASFENNAVRTITISPQPPPPPIASPPPPLPPPQPPSAPQAPQAGGVLPPTGLSFPSSVGISAMVLTCSLIASLYLCLKKPALRKSARRAYAPLGSFGEDAPRSGWADPYEPPSPLREAVPRRRHTFREQLLDFIAEVASPRASDAEAAARPQTRREQLMQYVAEMSSPRAADAALPRLQTRREQLMEYAAEAGTPRTEAGTPRTEAGTPRVETGTPRAAASPRPSRFDLLMEYAAEAGTPRAAISPRPTRFDHLMEFAAEASTPRGSAPPTPTAALAELELAVRPGSRAQYLPDEPEPALAVTRRQALLQLAAREENMAQFDRPLGLRRNATHAAVAAPAVDVEAPLATPRSAVSATPRSAVSATPRSAMSETPRSEMSGTPRSPLDPRAAGMDLRQFLRSLSSLASEAVEWTDPSAAATPRGEGGLDRNHFF